jgi:hypothetical protein
LQDLNDKTKKSQAEEEFKKDFAKYFDPKSKFHAPSDLD